MNEKISNTKLFGATDFKFSYLYHEYSGEVEFDFGLLNIISTDIETDSSNGFGSIEKADREITAISLARRSDGRTITFGYYDYQKSTEDHLYVRCTDERDLLTKFLICWRSKKWSPDIITGWNIAGFDIPIIIKRMMQVLPEGEYLKMSPFGYIKEKTLRSKMGNGDMKIESFDIMGVAIIDYMEAYLKFAPAKREAYSLNFISEFELGEKKIDYSEYGSLNGLYQKNPELYMDYNIKDSTLINKLEDKLHYIEQIVTMAYVIKCNFENLLFTVKPWDVLIINYLMDRKVVVPFFEQSEDKSTIAGGFVKMPVPGLYENIVTLDYTSLYPSVAMAFNISPDTISKQLKDRLDIDDVIHGDISNFTGELQRRDFAMTANACLFRRDKRGFIPEIMKYFFDERKKYRVLEKDAKKEHEADPKDVIKRNIFLKYKNFQTAFKLINNSGYGALVNQYCRWFDNRLGEAITLSGQMASKNVAVGINLYLNKTFETDKFDYVIYQDTDSTVGDTIININNKFQTIQSLFDEEDEYIRKDDFNNQYVKKVKGKTTISVSDNGEVRENDILYVMKHKVKKRIYRIKSKNGNYVDITQDHSIIVMENEKILTIKPSELDQSRHKIIYIIYDLIMQIDFDDSFIVEDLGIQEVDVYDIEVENDHNFFGNNILLHNSAYLNLKPLVDKMGITDRVEAAKACLKFTEKYLQPEVQRICGVLCAKLNAFEPEVISMKLEKICEQGFFDMKKRYALNVIYDEGIWNNPSKLKVVGLEPVRSGVPQVCRDKMREVYKMIFQKDQAGIYKLIEDFKEEFYKMRIDKIGSAISCNGMTTYYDPVKLYKLGTPMQVKAAMFYNRTLIEKGLDKDYERIYDGDKVKVCYLKKENPTKQEVVAVKGDYPKSLELEKYVDYDHQFEKTFMKPIRSVLNVVGYHAIKVDSLDDIFGV